MSTTPREFHHPSMRFPRCRGKLGGARIEAEPGLRWRSEVSHLLPVVPEGENYLHYPPTYWAIVPGREEGTLRQWICPSCTGEFSYLAAGVALAPASDHKQ